MGKGRHNQICAIRVVFYVAVPLFVELADMVNEGSAKGRRRIELAGQGSHDKNHSRCREVVDVFVDIQYRTYWAAVYVLASAALVVLSFTIAQRE